MPLADVIEARIVCRLGEQISINVRHWRISEILVPEPSLQAIADRLHADFLPKYQAVLSSLAEFRGVIARKIRPLPPSADFIGSGAAGFGLVAGAPMPKQISGVISLKTTLAGPAGRGRAYIPFPSTGSHETDTTPDPTYIANLNVIAAEMAGNILVTEGAGTLNLRGVVFHRLAGTSTDVNDAVSRNRWGTQRRRGDFGQPNISPV